jgi:hypothetical protein
MFLCLCCDVGWLEGFFCAASPCCLVGPNTPCCPCSIDWRHVTTSFAIGAMGRTHPQVAARGHPLIDRWPNLPMVDLCASSHPLFPMGLLALILFVVFCVLMLVCISFHAWLNCNLECILYIVTTNLYKFWGSYLCTST